MEKREVGFVSCAVILLRVYGAGMRCGGAMLSIQLFVRPLSEAVAVADGWQQASRVSLW